MSLSDRLKWILEADAKGAIKAFEDTGDAADKNLKKAEDRLDKLGGGLTKFGAGAMAFAGVAALGLGKLGGDAASYAVEMGKAADATGVGVEQFSRLNEVAGDVGISTEAVEKSIGFMNKTLGASPEKFAALGVEIGRAKDGTVDANETFLNVVDRLNAIKDPSERAAAGAKLLGRGWQEMGELIAGGSDRLRTSLESVSDAKVVNEDELARARDFRAAIDQMKDAFEDLAINIGQGVMPVISTLAKGVGTAVDLFGKLNAVTGGTVGTLLGIGTVGLGAAGALSFVAGKVITARDRFHDLVGKSDLAQAAMRKLGVQSATTAVEVEATATAITAEGNAAAVAAPKVEAFAGAQKLAALGGVLAAADIVGGVQRIRDAWSKTDTMDAIAANREALKKYGVNWKELKLDVSEGFKSIEEAQDIIVAAGGTLAVYGGIAAKIQPGLKATEDLTGATRVAAEAFREAERDGRKLAEAIAEKALGAAFDEGGDAAEESASQITIWSDAANDAKIRADQLEQASHRLRDAYAELMGELDREDAWASVNRALDEFHERMKSGELSADEQAQAVRDLQRQLADYVRDLDGIPDDEKTTIIAEIDRGEFDRVESLLAFLTRERLVNIKGNVVGADLRNAMEGRGSFDPDPNNWADIARWIAAGGTFGDAGGIINRPTLLLAGERRREALIPLENSPGNGPLPRFGGVTHVTINARNFHRGAVDEVYEFQRRNARMKGQRHRNAKVR